ncbi:hypothetical protein [Agromyces humatus]|uniref:Uncharacterized protein n=1 Tax=Agromyces humatus TaxID=279573 RepID=A0ABN2KWH4_9MICO|nr:hypothetical protein [Agromyces humatus]
MTEKPTEHGPPAQNADTRPTEALPDAAAAAGAPDPGEAPGPPKPNIHVSALIVWLTIFPLVAIFGTLLAPMMPDWHPVLRAFVLTLIVVPIAAYWLMPQMFRWYAAFARHRVARRANGSAR